MQQQEAPTLAAWLERAQSLGIRAASLRTTNEIRAVGDADGVTVGPVCWVQILGYADGLLLRTPRLELDAEQTQTRLTQAGLRVRRSVDHLY